ncbi:MAG: phytoene dehydrogenase-like protein [Cellvibrionaceae bacterium]|jgi:phytoene dehydrogenase-like protein
MYDAIIIGAGHNGLICAGYLAKAGQKVLVLERRHIVGGAVVTEEMIPGFKFDLGGSAHILIHHTPVVADLELEKYGLEYLDVDPLFWAPFPDGQHITVYKDLDKTCESIAKVNPADAEKYREFVKTWTPLAEATVETFNNPPTMGNVVKNLGFKSGLGAGNWERLSDIFRGYGPLLKNWFDGEEVPAIIGWMAAQSGPPPTEPLSGPFALWHPMYHVSGMKRPKGGSGMLTQSLAKMIEAHGGTILTSSPAEKILLENGKAAGVQFTNTKTGITQTAEAKTIVSGAHIHTTMALLGEENMPQPQRNLLKNSRVGNGFGMILRCAMDELPNYTATNTPKGVAGEEHTAMQFVCPSLDYLDAAYGDYLAKRPSENPALIAMTFSTTDPTLAPKGKHTMFLWGQYYPYELASKENWDDIAEREAEKMLDTLGRYAPNVKGAVIDKLIETPLYLERELGLHRGNVMHLEMSIDQMFMLRPALTVSQYKTPVKGLYLTGASTHPGGGIMGAAGRNAAQVVLRDGRRWF